MNGEIRSVEPSRVAAESSADELARLREFAHEATKAITGLTAQGSEFFAGKIGEIYVADLPLCVQHVRERDGRNHRMIVAAVKARQAAEAERDFLAARVLDLEAEYERLQETMTDWQDRAVGAEGANDRLQRYLQRIDDMPSYPTVDGHEVEGLRSRYEKALDLAAEALRSSAATSGNTRDGSGTQENQPQQVSS